MSIFSYLKTHSVLATTLVIVVTVASVITGRVSSRNSGTATTTPELKRITVVNVDSFTDSISRISGNGVVRAVAQVDLKSQVSAPIQTLNVSLGDTVEAGAIIAEFSNSDVKALFDQAKATITIDGVITDAAKKTAVDAIETSYLTADEVIHTQFDPLFFNQNNLTPQLSTFINDRNLYATIRDTRSDITQMFTTWKASLVGLSATSSDITIQNAFDLAEKNIAIIKKLFDAVSKGLNDASTATLPSDATLMSTWKSLVTAARSTLATEDSTLATSEKTFNNSGANVQNLQAQLDKTIIRAPWRGTIATLPVRTGELVTAGQLVATIVGEGGLEVDAFVSGEDAGRFMRGAEATIGGKARGIVTRVAPSVNPINKKLEVKILITDEKGENLVVGQNVPITVAGTQSRQDTKQTSYFVPIQNVKIVPGDAYVFTVDSESKLMRSPTLTLGKVTGNYVEIVNGISPGMEIVSPVYELEAGQKVIVDRSTK